MAYEFIKMNTERLSTASENVEDGLAAIERDIAQLEEAFGVLDAMWEGPAKTVFKDKYVNDINEMRELLNALKNFNGFEFTAHSEYTNCERNVNAIIGSIGR